MSRDATGGEKNTVFGGCSNNWQICRCGDCRWFRSLMRASMFNHKIEHAVPSFTSNTLNGVDVLEAKYSNVEWFEKAVMSRTSSDPEDLMYMAFGFSKQTCDVWANLGPVKYGEKWFTNIGGYDSFFKSLSNSQ